MDMEGYRWKIRESPGTSVLKRKAQGSLLGRGCYHSSTELSTRNQVVYNRTLGFLFNFLLLERLKHKDRTP